MMQRVRVLLVDDHAVVREGLRAVLEDFDDIEVVGEANHAIDALALIASAKPDVIISDLRMPGMPVADAIRQAKANWPKLQVIIFSSFAEPFQVRAVLDAGAIGYLTKDALADELHQSILSAACGIPCVHSSIQELLNAANELPEVAIISRLAPRERDVLHGIAQAKSNKEIARSLGMTEGTVKSYVSVLFTKLNINDRTEAALIAMRAGLIRE